MGYDGLTKAYRVWFSKENRVERHRDLIFVPDKSKNYAMKKTKEHEKISLKDLHLADQTSMNGNKNIADSQLEILEEI